MPDCCIGTHMAMWFAASIPPSPTSGISPILSLPDIPTLLHCPSLAPHNRPLCVIFPSLCPCVLIVQLLLMSENMQCLVFCSCVSLLRMMICSFIHVVQRTWAHPFLWLHSIPWCICATFSLSSLSSIGIWVGSKSLLFCKQCCNEHMCACIFITEWFIILWVYTQ